MVGPEVTLFSYEILGLVGPQGAGPHDLLRMARRGPLLDWAGESRYYVEPKRLARLGYLEARKEPGRTRERTVSPLTDKGPDALRAWAATPARLSPLESEPLIRLLVADLVGERATLTGLRTLREDVAGLLERLADTEASAERLPRRQRCLEPADEFVRRFLELHLELVDRLEKEAAGDPDPGEAPATPS